MFRRIKVIFLTKSMISRFSTNLLLIIKFIFYIVYNEVFCSIDLNNFVLFSSKSMKNE